MDTAGSDTLSATLQITPAYSITTNPNATLDITLATQTITFPTLAEPRDLRRFPVTLNATASSGLTVSYTVSGPATLSGSTLTFTGAGTVVVTASQAGDSSYGAATPVPQTIIVNPAPALRDGEQRNACLRCGESDLHRHADRLRQWRHGGLYRAELLLDGHRRQPAWPIYDHRVPGQSHRSTELFVERNQRHADRHLPAANTITFAQLSPVTYGASPVTLNATSSSSLPVSFIVSGPATLNGTLLTLTGAGTVLVTASQPGNTDYSAAHADTTVAHGKSGNAHPDADTIGNQRGLRHKHHADGTDDRECPVECCQAER